MLYSTAYSQLMTSLYPPPPLAGSQRHRSSVRGRGREHAKLVPVLVSRAGARAGCDRGRQQAGASRS